MGEPSDFKNSEMSRVFFLNRFFHPDHSATSQLLTDLAFHLAKTGGVVHVISSRQVYDDPNAILPSQDIVQGVRVTRVWTTRFGRQHLLGRTFDYSDILSQCRLEPFRLAQAWRYRRGQN